MSRGAIFEGLYQTLLGEAALLEILGAPASQNARVYRSYPQFQSLLATVPFEPLQRDAWVVIDEPSASVVTTHTMVESSWEGIEPVFYVFSTKLSLADEVIDVLDMHWHWQIEQQRDVQYGDRILLFTRRFRTEDGYEQAIKLYKKAVQYRMLFVRETHDA